MTKFPQIIPFTLVASKTIVTVDGENRQHRKLGRQGKMGLIHAQGQLKNKTLRKNDKPSVSNSFSKRRH